MPGGCWSSLPSDIVEQVAGSLSTDADHLSTRQVCTHWRASTCPPTAFRPWIVADRTQWSRLDDEYCIWLLRRAERVEIGPPPAGLPYRRGASHGWFALTDHAKSPTRLLLWEPLSNTQIPLPSLNPVAHVFLSGDPLAPSPSGWMAIASQRQNTGWYKALFFRPEDAAWSLLHVQAIAGIGSVAYHGGKIYYLETSSHYLYLYDIGATAASPPICLGIFPMPSRLSLLCRCDLFDCFRGAYVVTCNTEPLLVVLRLRRGRPWMFAEVYKLELAEDGGLLPLRECDRVRDIGEHSLFLGGSDTFALSAKEFPSIKRNHIYCVAHERNYTGGGHTLRYWAFVFNLGSYDLEEIAYPAELRDDGTNWAPRTWFCLRRPFVKHQQ